TSTPGGRRLSRRSILPRCPRTAGSTICSSRISSGTTGTRWTAGRRSTTRRAFEPVDGENAAGRLVELARKVKDAKKEVGAPDRPAAHRAAEWTDRLRSTLKSWHAFYSGYDPVYTWWADKPWKEADKELEGYASLLRDKSGE